LQNTEKLNNELTTESLEIKSFAPCSLSEPVADLAYILLTTNCNILIPERGNFDSNAYIFYYGKKNQHKRFREPLLKDMRDDAAACIHT
jgi:hypothetical protein